ncbi:MAG TPA: DNA replication and repair protein RecF [Gaiellaceae bacterium]|nr:DNA replication and repair protein RecF [Gaiellaceae bacterium]
MLRSFRSYDRLELALRPGLVLAVGPNGAGKTNLLEALHVGTQGFSPRTRTDRQLVRFGADAARVGVRGERGGVPVHVDVTLAVGAAKHATLNGAPLRTVEQLRSELATLVFTPDRLGVVKGAPAARRAYFDRALGRLSPARAQLPTDYGAAVAQRNAALRRVSIGVSSRDAVEPWTLQVAELGAALVDVRREGLALLGPPFAAHAAAFGLDDATLRYDGESPTVEQLDARLDRDIDRGVTGLGPHLDDVVIAAGTRELREFGSQGEQRLAVLALLLAEAELIGERRGTQPLLLLDDVLSELDPDRRRILAELVAGRGQTVITATDPAMLPADPDQLVEVRPGSAR